MGLDYNDMSGKRWHEFVIEPVNTTYLHIQAESHYTQGDNGFQEIEAYGKSGQ